MAKHSLSPQLISNWTGIDPEEVLLALWDEGLDYIVGLGSKINKKDQKRICEKFGVPFGSAVSKKKYWMSQLVVSEQELDKIISDMGFLINTKAHSVPKGSVKKLCSRLNESVSLRREMQSATITPDKVGLLVKEPPKLRWEMIGHLPANGGMRFLTCGEVKAAHYLLAEDFRKHHDPIEPAGIKNENLLSSAIQRPQTGLGENLKYPRVEMAAAALLHSIIHNHPFYNGNKRTALVAMLTFLDENSFIFEAEDQELFQQVLRIANHKVTEFRPRERDDMEVLEISRWIKQRARPIRKGELPVQFRKLKKILMEFGCTFEQRENKCFVSRKISKGGLFSRKKSLRFTLHCSTDGQEVDQQTISRLRHELWLNEESGIDSEAFYNTQEEIIEGFIQRYRKTLTNLAKV